MSALSKAVVDECFATLIVAQGRAGTPSTNQPKQQEA